jgi:CheY-like chemotaxis protein
LARKIRHVLNGQQHRNRVRASFAAKPPAPPIGQRPVLPRYSVLLVEDDFLIRMSTADLLAELGHQVSEASSAEEAIAMIAVRSFDVVVTDLGLPGLSGGEFAQQARKLSPDVGIIFATGNDRIPEEAAVEGAVLLKKPYGSQEIAIAFEKIAVQKG